MRQEQNQEISEMNKQIARNFELEMLGQAPLDIRRKMKSNIAKKPFTYGE